MLKYTVIMILLLFSSVDKVVEKSSMNFCTFSFHDLGGLYMLPIVIVFDKLLPVI